MYVLITYDVNITSPEGAKRLRNVAKICTNYDKRVQNSVFECLVTEAQYVVLKSCLKDVIDKKLDNIRFYLLGKNWKRRIETLGQANDIDFTDNLII